MAIPNLLGSFKADQKPSLPPAGIAWSVLTNALLVGYVDDVKGILGNDTSLNLPLGNIFFNLDHPFNAGSKVFAALKPL